jgi:fatty-acyl-CoA synthase
MSPKRRCLISPDDRWVQKVVAAVVLQPGSPATPADIVAHARKSLAAFKCPKSVYLVDTLPRSGAGKVLRKHLRAAFAPTRPA